MSKLRVLIADDEAPARSKMQRLLGKFDQQLELIYTAENGIDALENIHKLRPDLVFLDIEMPGMNGLDVAESIENEPMPSIVFTTAYSEHAIRAFELRALDYLLKPFNEERLQAAIEKVQSGLASTPHKTTLAELEGEDEESGIVDLRVPFAGKIGLPSRDRYRLAEIADVICAEVDDRCVRVWVGKEDFALTCTLDTFEKVLTPDKFFRVNRSCIVNIDHIRDIVLWFGNRFKVVMHNEKEIVCSRERSKAIKQMLRFQV